MRSIPILLRLVPVFAGLTLALPAAERDRSGPRIVVQAEAYQLGDHWFCPQCRQEVPNGDRTGWDLRLSLSEWHDLLIDPAYFQDKIRAISDAELVEALHLPALEPVLRATLQAGDHARLASILHDYFAGRPDNGRLSRYDAADKRYFGTADEFRRELADAPARAAAIREAAAAVYTPETGFTIRGVRWGAHIDFNHEYTDFSKWGVHYLGFVGDLTNDYLLRRDPATASAFASLFEQWYDQLDRIDPPTVAPGEKSYDFVWYELGLANRTEHLINAHRVFARELSPEAHLKLLKIILGSTRWLDQAVARVPFHPHNWQTHAAFTLSYAAVAYPEFVEASGWLERGRANIVRHLQTDILDDGGYVERTTGYAAYMFSVYYRYMLMLEHFTGDRALQAKYLPRLEQMIEFYALTNTPVGVNAPFNDARRDKALVPVFKEMGLFFRRGDFIGAVRHEFTAEELAALPVAVTEPKVKSVDFPFSRYVVMRDAWDPASYFMMLNYGDFQNHCHFDQLSFELYANGAALAVDAGMSPTGYVDPNHATWSKHPSAHNMLTINQAVPEKLNQAGYDKVWSPQSRLEVFAATHDGYLRYQQARHRRHVIFAKARYWLIVDEVQTRGRNQEMDFNLHTPCTMSELADGFASAQARGFVIKHDRRDAGVVRLRQQGKADLGGLDGEPRYRDIDWLIFRKQLTGERAHDRLATLIFPHADNAGFDPATVIVERVDLQDEAAIGYRVLTGGREDLVIISDGFYRRFTDDVAGDFLYAVISRDATGTVDYVGAVGVVELAVKGGPTETFKAKRDYEYVR